MLCEFFIPHPRVPKKKWVVERYREGIQTVKDVRSIENCTTPLDSVLNEEFE